MELRDKEQYENIIELLKRTLSFYANKKNYGDFIIENSIIDMDRGQQARFTINQVKNIMKMLDGSKPDYDELINDANNQMNPEQIINSIKKISKSED